MKRRIEAYEVFLVRTCFRCWIDDCGILLACLFVDDEAGYVTCLGSGYNVLVWVKFVLAELLL